MGQSQDCMPFTRKDIGIMCDGCNGQKEEEDTEIHKKQLIYMFKQFPLGIEYDHFELPNVRDMIHSTVMGGNIMNPVAKDNRSPKTIYNSIEKGIENIEI